MITEKVCCVCGDNFKSRNVSYEGDYKGKILCNKHALQVKRKGKITDDTRSRRRDERKCDICGDIKSLNQYGSEGVYKGSLLCSKHASQLRSAGKILDIHKSHVNRERVCDYCASNHDVCYNRSTDQMLCRRHYSQLRSYGKLYERTVFDPNEIIIYDDYAEVIMYNSNHEELCRATIDVEDVDIVSKYKWRLANWGYAETGNGNGKCEEQTMMQRLIMNAKSGELVDHINRVMLDNRKTNLRITNKSVNSINTGIRESNSSGVTGVSYNKYAKSWRSYISFEGNRIELGHFRDKEKAIKSRLNAEIKYYPDHPPQKELFKDYEIGFQ